VFHLSPAAQYIAASCHDFYLPIEIDSQHRCGRETTALPSRSYRHQRNFQATKAVANQSHHQFHKLYPEWKTN
jgi:hypothetical protein